VRPMIRHVVVFTWSPDADAGRRATTVEALRRLRQDVGGMDSLVVADDAGEDEDEAASSPLSPPPQAVTRATDAARARAARVGRTELRMDRT